MRTAWMSTKTNKQRIVLFSPPEPGPHHHCSHTFILWYQRHHRMENPLQTLINSHNPPVKHGGSFFLSFKEETWNQQTKGLTWMEVAGKLKNGIWLKIGYRKLILCSKKMGRSTSLSPKRTVHWSNQVEQTELSRFGSKGFGIWVVLGNLKDSLVKNFLITYFPILPRAIRLEKAQPNSSHDLDPEIQVVMLSVMLKIIGQAAFWGFIFGSFQT